MYGDFYFSELSPKDTFRFQCQRCGRCCQNIRSTVAVNSLDIFNIAKHLNIPMSEATDLYTQPVMIMSIIPVAVLQVNSETNNCVFLKNNACSIYEARPYVCRVFPLSVLPHEKERELVYGKVSEDQHHYAGDEYRVKDWMDIQLSKEQREVLLLDKDTLGPISRCLLRSKIVGLHSKFLFMYLYYRQENYDLSKPFLPQYKSNINQMLEEFEKLLKN